MHPYEKFLLQTYALRALGAGGPMARGRPQKRTVTWLIENASDLGCQAPEVDPEMLDFHAWPADRKTLDTIAPMVALLTQRTRTAPPLSGLERRMLWLGKTLKLSGLEADVLQATVRAALVPPVELLLMTHELGHSGEIKPRGLSMLTGHNKRWIDRALMPSQPLRLLGLIEDRRGGDFGPSHTVIQVARMATCNPDRLHAAMVGKTRPAELAWEDFAHLGAEADLAERLLNGALAQGTRGINILLYGAPGTGKTAFVRTLAARIGAHPIFAGESDGNDTEPSRSARIAALAISQAVAGCAGRKLLVVDEADDIFTGVDDADANSRVGSKVFMNRLVESTPAPTIWITNHKAQLGEAVLRRMSMAIRFPEPSRSVRRRVVERIAARRKVRLSAGAFEQLSHVQAAPAVIDLAMGVGKLTAGGRVEIERAARSITKAMRSTPAAPTLAGATPFDPTLSEADQDLAALADRICSSRQDAISFCLHGPPGTGKSAYARYIAERLELDVVEKRASDLLSKWVGESEERIAGAFQEAADRRAMLILDEADSLLRNRERAQHSWEVTQVNEMLTWMERHPYPFACTTNLMESLDPATLRRFLFKVQFLAMRPDQAREAFRRSFGCGAPAGLDNLDTLAPGDFALVARKAQVMGVGDPAALLTMLENEVAAKAGGMRRRIGF